MKKTLILLITILVGTFILATNISADTLSPYFNYYRLEVGESFDLNMADCSFESSDTAVAEVSADGIVSAKAIGNADITITQGKSSGVTHVIVVDSAPLDLYTPDYEGGEEKLLMVIGDSLSATTSLNGDAPNWHGFIARQFDVSVNNYSKGGTTLAGKGVYPASDWEGFVPRLERAIEGTVIADTDAVAKQGEIPDLFMVLGGINDHLSNGTGTALGELGERETGTVYGAVADIIETTYANYPETKLVFFTPTRLISTGYGTTGENGRGLELDDYAEAIKEACAEYGVPCVDFYNNDRADMVSFAAKYHKVADGIHPSVAGYNIMGKVAITEMEKLGVIKTHGYTEADAETKALSLSGSADTYKYYSAEEIKAKSHTYGAFSFYENSLISSQRYSLPTLTDGVLHFGPVAYLTSNIAPTITLNLNDMDFPITEYPYVTLVYKTSSTKDNAKVFLGGNDNHRSVLTENDSTAITTDEVSAITLNVLDMATEDITFGETEIYDDYYLAYEFFDNTRLMTTDSYVDVLGVGFFKNEADASVSAFEGVCGDDLVWEFDYDRGLTISGSGDMYDYTEENPAPWADSAHLIKTITIGADVTSIGNYAFANLANLELISISGSVASIGDYAFKGCSSLANALISAPVVSIGANAFDGVSDDFTIRGYEDSYVNEYATANGIKFAGPIIVKFVANGITLYSEELWEYGTTLVYPEDLAVEPVDGIEFTGWDTPEGTVINESLTVNAKFVAPIRLTANELSGAGLGSYLDASAPKLISVDNTSNDYVRFSISGADLEASGTALNARSRITFDGGVSVSDTPYMKIYYKSDYMANSQYIGLGGVTWDTPVGDRWSVTRIGTIDSSDESEWRYVIYDLTTSSNGSTTSNPWETVVEDDINLLHFYGNWHKSTHFGDAAIDTAATYNLDIIGVHFFATKEQALNDVMTPPNEQFTVTFKNGDEVFESVTVNSGDLLVYPEATPTLDGYNFIGWSVSEGTVIKKDTVVNAIFDTPVDYGDVNGNGSVDVIDMITLARYVANWENINVIENNCDLNADAEVGPADSIIMKRHWADWEAYKELPYIPAE